MRLYVPHYYASFHCIAGACRHSCCIGWEIDIDDETCALYEEMPGELGARVRESLITGDDTTCFRLTTGERCPHLNEAGLCEIILGAGEDYLAQICYDHPRFRSWFSDRVEMGIGLSCEAAVQLVLSTVEPVTYVLAEDDGEQESLTPFEGEVLSCRDACVQIAQARTFALASRLTQLAALADISLPNPAAWRVHLERLERLDPAWDAALAMLPTDSDEPWNIGTSLLSEEFEIPLEQFLVYLLYRHLPNAETPTELRAYIAFAVMTCHTMRALLASHERIHGSVTRDDLAEYVRMWSGEVEYSTENTEAGITYLMEREAK